MQSLAPEHFALLCKDATVIERDRHGDKVLRLADGTMLKLFRRKRLLSSAAWYPYAQRFADNCVRLAALGILCPQTIRVFRIPSIMRDAVHYRPLPGLTVRQQIAAGLNDTDADALRVRLKGFIADLHRQGVYFRSLHLGNIVLTPEGGLGLIDIADLTVRRHAIGQLSQRRNMRHLLRYPADATWLAAGTGFPLG